MASLDLDPIFVKALRLLHSKARDSADQLRQLVNDSLHSTGHDSKDHVSSVKLSINYGGRKGSPKHPPSSDAGATSAKKSSAAVKEEHHHLKIKKEVEKRSFEKLKQDLTELNQEAVVAKKPRMDLPKPSASPKTVSSVPTVTIKLENPAITAPSEDNTSASDIALEMGLACVVCRSFDVAPGNRLVECQDCHTLYHQECHRPPITEQDVNDPRLVWYCAKCTKNIKKLASKNQKTATSKSTTSTSSTSPATAKETITITIAKPVKPDPAASTSLPSTHIFKRVETKVAGSSSNSGGNGGGGSGGSTSSAAINKPIGLAGLAASLSGKSHPTPKPPHPGGKPLPPIAGKTSSTSSSGGNGSSAAGKSSSSHSSTSSSTSSSSTSGSKRDAFSALVASGKTSSGGSSSTRESSGSGGNGGGFASSKLSSTSSSILATTLTASKSASSGGGAGGGGGGNGGSGAAASSAASTTVNKASSSLMSADKRLQIMKKKAAAKMQEKRRLSAK